MSTEIPLAGVLGDPIAHSRSPRLHRHWLRRYGLPGFYVPLKVDAANLGKVLEVMPQMGFVGANVTIPHKEAALTLCDLVTDRAALIGAVNTLIFRDDGRLHGDNTDGYGFLANIRHHVPDWQPRSGPAAVFGAGGASRAVIISLLEAGVPEVRVSNRTLPRAEALQNEFGSRLQVFEWTKAGNILDGSVTVVNTTSLGMEGQAAFRVPLDGLQENAVVNDLVYAPLKTEFLLAAEQQGCRTVDGLGMLLHQAVPGFERWFGTRPEVDDALRDAVLA